MSVQIENKSGFDYDVSIDYKGKNHSAMSLHDGFVVASFLGEFNILDSDVEKVANDVQITISELNGNVSLQKTFSYADGFVIKYDLKRVPKMLRRNHIELSLELIKTESGEISLVVSDDDDE